MANITINAKTSKKGLIEFIRQSIEKVTEENLLSRIKYTINGVDKNEADVPKSDLYDLAKEIMSFIAPAPQPVAVENSPKPKLGKKKVAEPVEDTTDETEEEETTEEAPAEKEAPAPAKKPTKKVTPKKEKAEPATVVATDGLTKKDLPMARIFPKEIDHESLGKLIACPDKYHSIKEIREAIEGDKNLIFACYWTKRHIKEFSYSQSYEVPVPKGGFPHDLDTLQALYVCEGIDRIYALSTYTEAMFRFVEDDLVPTECEANDGSKFMMRYSAGLEFEIYEVVEA